MKHKVYLAGPMRGIPEFNFPAFRIATQKLRDNGFAVFSPAERDCERHGVDVSKGNHTGDMDQLTKDHNFSLRVALHEDTAFICLEADAIAMMPGWERSKGAVAERALAIALGLPVLRLRANGTIKLYEQ